MKIGSYSPEGEEFCYDILRPGDIFGNLNYLNGQFSEFAKALTPVELRAFDPDFFKQLITNQPKLSEWFFKELVSRWCRAEDRLYAVRSLDSTEKVKRILPYFQDLISDSHGKSIHLLKLITLHDLADLTGLTRQPVSKLILFNFSRLGKAPKKSLVYLKKHNGIPTA